jgi:glutamate dehydrogenase
MPDDLGAPGTGMRAELLREIEAALGRIAPPVPPQAGLLLRRLVEAIPTVELAAEPPEALAADAAGLWALAARRAPRQTLVRVLPPGPGRGRAAIAQIVTDDMPFLVDSVLATLSQRGLGVARLLHPILTVRRDAQGQAEALDAPGAPRESMMHVELASAGGDPAALEAALGQAMAELRRAVEDFDAMLAQLRLAADEIRPMPDGEQAARFLGWLGGDHFVLLGHRRLMLVGDGFVAEDGLGVLRDPALPVFDALRDLAAPSPKVLRALAQAMPLTVAKANMRSSVHRPQHADVIATRITDAAGQVVGVRLFLGLFAAEAYNRNPRSIPWLAEKVERILATAGVEPETHDGRALRNILDTWPRDELFQASEAEILAGARRAVDLAIRPRAALAVRIDPFERFVSAIAWLPRDSFDTRLREKVGAMLARVYEGHLSTFYIALGDGPLARVLYIIGTRPGAVPDVDVATLEVAIVQAARAFADRLGRVLDSESGEEEGQRLLARWRDAFPPAYRETMPAAQAAADLHLAEQALATGRPAARLDRPPGAGPRDLVLALAHPGRALPLADALPLFESLDLRAVEEAPYRLAPAGAGPVVLHLFTLEAGMAAEPARFGPLLEALAALLDGRAEADGFNRLVLRAGLGWRDCWLLRAMFRWLKQVGFNFAQEAVQAALAAQPAAARLLVELFRARFDPDRPRDPAAEAALEARWSTLLDANEDPDADRILSRLKTLLDATLRTNFFRRDDFLALKIDSAAAGEMPAPRPWREIFVHSPRMEGCHLRAGPVARGGIRWSDRREDFRTEILGLMKAQRLKNVVIVPTGAKGGFVLKHPPAAGDRAAVMAEGVACYSILIRAMLDLADNLQGSEVVPPPRTVRRDGDDPYIVAAADKGTATFSDIANGLSAEYGFWLGDAFASGGSKGYDHKAMGITARGAWVMIARHFAELGPEQARDIQAQPFTMVGVGDMSGDVFGNGLLISRQTRLLAAFDHRHIFIDPDPDPAAAFAERARLFALPRSSWADYEARLISEGGGVFPRNARFIPVSPQMRALLGLEGERADPATVMRAILKAPVDLLYFGGIGTYVKASTESQAEAGDRANDTLRIDGRDIRALVVGEGANLGITQAGRIEAARHGAGGAGVRLNTDALDNSAGVSTSDHEVNIKILLADGIASGALTERQRDDLLAAMTDDVAALVLADNQAQSLAISLEARSGAEALPAQAALMRRLEAAGLLDRAVAGLPEAAAMTKRIGAGEALTRPELAALLPHAKLWLTEAIEASALPDDPALQPLLAAYFPPALRERLPEAIPRHRLRRELIGTILANGVANRLGCAGLARLATDRSPAEAVRAAWLAGEMLGLEAAAQAADAAPAPGEAGSEARFEALGAIARLWEATARELLGLPELGLPLAQALDALRPGIAELAAAESARAAASPTAARLQAAGLPAELASLAAAAPALAAAPLVVRLAQQAGVGTPEAAAAWMATGDAFGLAGLRHAVLAAAIPGAFGTRARSALMDELAAAQSRLALARLRGEAIDPDGALALAREAAAAGDLAAITVAGRALARLA